MAVHNPLSKPSPKKLIEAFNHLEQAYVILEAHNRYKAEGEPNVDMAGLRDIHKSTMRIAHWANAKLEEARKPKSGAQA